MTTTKTTISRHIGVSDILLVSRTSQESTSSTVETETELLDWLTGQSFGDDDGYPELVRCRDTGDVVGFAMTTITSSQRFDDCDSTHWRLVHCTIETEQEIHP